MIRLLVLALAGVVTFSLVATGGSAQAREGVDKPVTSTTETTTSAGPTKTRHAPATPGNAGTADRAETTATESTSEPVPGSAARTLTPYDVSVVAGCEGVTVYLRIARFEGGPSYAVSVAGQTKPAVYDEEGAYYRQSFEVAPVGVYPVVVTGSDGTRVTSEATLWCPEDKPVGIGLEVTTKCVGGLGLIIAQVSYHYPAPISLQLVVDGVAVPVAGWSPAPQFFGNVTEIRADGSHTVDIGAPDSPSDPQTVELDCAAPPGGGPAPTPELPATGTVAGGLTVVGFVTLMLGVAFVAASRRHRRA